MDNTPWVHPDWIVGPDNDDLVAMFGDIDWHDPAAVKQRVADLQALDPNGEPT
jgi:hypothetical protein